MAPALAVVIAVAGLATLPGSCSAGDTATTLAPPRTVTARLRLDVGAAQRHGFGSTGAGPAGAGPAAAAATGLAYAVPAGWTARAPAAMQAAGFVAADGVDVSLTVLARDGGGLRANVDRWRGQMGLPPLSEAELDGLPRLRALGRDDAVAVELHGRLAAAGTVIESAGLLAVVAQHGSSTVFVKLVGPAPAVEVQRAAFAAFVASLRAAATAAHDPPPAPPPDMPATPSGAGPLRWTAPTGWALGAMSSMRVVTFHPQGDRAVHAYVVIMAGDAGGVAANLDRWNEQLGLPPLDVAARKALPQTLVLGALAPRLEAFNAKDGVIGVVGRIGDDRLFVKMVGPPDKVRAARDDFVTFCESLGLRQ